MADLSRLNPVIKALESGKCAFSTFSPATMDNAIELSQSKYDSVVFEGEHLAWDPKNLRDTLQYMLLRGQIAKNGVAPSCAPFVRIPANGVEKNQFLAKQALDAGVYGVVWPHISTVEEAYNAVAACRYPRLKNKPLYEPAGIRGDGPAVCSRYWGVGQQEYYDRADVWPLAPKGEVFVIIQIEDTAGVANLDDMLKNVPGIGAVLIGEGDLSQELGVPRQYEHPVVLEHMAQVVATCKKHNVVVGHPHVEMDNMERVMGEGFRFLMCSAPKSYGKLDKAMKLVGR